MAEIKIIYEIISVWDDEHWLKKFKETKSDRNPVEYNEYLKNQSWEEWRQ